MTQSHMNATQAATAKAGPLQNDSRARVHTVSWRKLDAPCEKYARPHCESPGEGWVIDTDRPPLFITVAYLCREHAAQSVQNRKRLGTESRFTPGRTDEIARSLDIVWYIPENPDAPPQEQTP